MPFTWSKAKGEAKIIVSPSLLFRLEKRSFFFLASQVFRPLFVFILRAYGSSLRRLRFLFPSSRGGGRERKKKAEPIEKKETKATIGQSREVASCVAPIRGFWFFFRDKRRGGRKATASSFVSDCSAFFLSLKNKAALIFNFVIVV
jgi:hypothetical protein